MVQYNRRSQRPPIPNNFGVFPGRESILHVDGVVKLRFRLMPWRRGGSLGGLLIRTGFHVGGGAPAPAPHAAVRPAHGQSVQDSVSGDGLGVWKRGLRRREEAANRVSLVNFTSQTV